jgi:hypothetical protein
VDAKIHWISRLGSGTVQPSYPFGMPFLLATDKVFGRIRNETVDHMPDGTLFPTPVQQYDPWVVREALHNCVAHQDYVLGGKINVVEHPDRLVLTNLGEFIPQSVEWMLEHQSPPEHYRNQWLIDGMIRLRMIEQAGNRGLDDQHYQQLVVGYLRKYKRAKRADFDDLLMGKLAAVLTPEQKTNKVKNLLQAMKRAKIIDCEGPRSAAVWFLSKDGQN